MKAEGYQEAAYKLIHSEMIEKYFHLFCDTSVLFHKYDDSRSRGERCVKCDV